MLRVGVFLRGPRGTTPREIADRFQPVREKFIELVGHMGTEATNVDHPGDTLKIDTTDPENWEEAIDWMYKTSTRWLAAVEKIF